MADFKLLNEGTIVVLTPENDDAQWWLDDNVVTAETLTWGRGIVVEARYIGDLIVRIKAEGFTIEEE